MKKYLTLLISVISFILTPCFSQNSNEKKRPKVALVLSGGGAKGLAEIPLIEALEEEGIPVDMVLGTSMGSLLGSLYAAGYSPKEIRETMLKMDFMDILNDPTEPIEHIPREAFTTKTDSHALVTFSFKKIGAAPGIIGDQKILSELDNHLAKVMEIKDFDKLDKPFRAMGTNIRNGESIVFSKGSIVDAVRGSMSLPAIFTPAPMEDGTYVMDGGLRNNIPIKIAKEMGADIVIAMDVASATDVDPHSISDMVSVSVLVFNMIISSNAIEQHKMADLLLRPDLKKFNTLDFVKAKGIIKQGEECVSENREALHKIALKLQSMGVELEKKDPDRISHYASIPDKKIEEITIKDISFSEPVPLPKQKVFQKFTGQIFDSKTQKKFSEVLAKQRNKYRLASLSYETFNGSDDSSIKIVVKANHYDQKMNKFFAGGQTSLIINESEGKGRFKVNPDFTIGTFFVRPFDISWKLFFGNTTGTTLSLLPGIAKIGETKFSGDIGGSLYYGSLEPKSNILANNRYANEDKGVDAHAGFMFRALDILSLKAGIKYDLDHIYSTNCSYNIYSAYGELALDNTYSDVCPESGVKLDAAIRTGEYVGTDKDMTTIFAFNFRLANYIPLIKNWTTFGWEASVNANHFPHVLNQGYSDIGGFDGMPGITNGTLRRDSAMAGITIQQKILEVNGMPLFIVLKGKILATDGYDPLFSMETPKSNYFDGFSFPDDLIKGAGGYLGLKTPFGNILLGGSANSSGNWYITIGVF